MREAGVDRDRGLQRPGRDPDLADRAVGVDAAAVLQIDRMGCGWRWPSGGYDQYLPLNENVSLAQAVLMTATHSSKSSRFLASSSLLRFHGPVALAPGTAA